LERQRDLVRPGRLSRDRPRLRTDAGPRPRPRLLARLQEGDGLAVLDAGGNGRLPLLRPLPALGFQQVTLPLSHVGPYRWVFYLLPVVIVVGAIIRNALAQRRHHGDDEEGGESG